MHNFIPLADDAQPDQATVSTIKRWVREALKLPDETVITISESKCVDPGCPLVETVIAVFDDRGVRKWKLTRPQPAINKVIVTQALATPGTN
ncbi:MAG TPA: hypothetical protein VKC60_18155 [Opitutaceae bacterium]|nr:hypothetical protein [Opitutaceae bacterium]